MTEPDVAITDFLLAVLCSFFAFRLWKISATENASMQSLWAAFFCAVGISALLGGVTHGFFNQSGTAANRALWVGVMACIGASSVLAWVIGSRLWMNAAGQSIILAVALICLAVFLYTVLFGSASFKTAIAMYVPATVFLMISFAVLLARGAGQPVMLGLIGVLMTLAAAWLQQAGVGLHPRYFNHNAVYHVAQAAALSLIFIAAQRR